MSRILIVKAADFNYYQSKIGYQNHTGKDLIAHFIIPPN